MDMGTTSPNSTRRKHVGRVFLLLVVVGFCVSLPFFGIMAFRQLQLAEFQVRLQTTSEALESFKKAHGCYPGSLKELDDGKFTADSMLAGAVYQYRTNALTNVNELLLEGRFDGHAFRIRSERGVIFK